MTGKYSDELAGLQNNLNRWYDPKLGKWVSQDPIGFAAGDANLYRYVGNEVTRFSDPGGLERTLSEWHAYFASNRPETLTEWEAWRRIQNNKRFLEKHREHEKKRNRGDWSYRLAELPPKY